jgi:hypothetical protein
MPILVHEAICTSVWREKVLPLLLNITPESKSVFVPYMVVSKRVTYNSLRNKFKCGFALEVECSACM